MGLNLVETLELGLWDHIKIASMTFMDWFFTPVVFFPFMMIHLATFFIVHMLKHFLCSWLPLTVGNGLIYWHNKKIAKTKSNKIPYRMNLCPVTRKTLTIMLAFVVAWFMSSRLWQPGALPGDFVIDSTTIHMLNGALNPLAMFCIFKLLGMLGPFGRDLADKFGARDVEVEVIEEPVDDGDGTETRFAFTNAFGIKPNRGNKK